MVERQDINPLVTNENVKRSFYSFYFGAQHRQKRQHYATQHELRPNIHAIRQQAPRAIHEQAWAVSAPRLSTALYRKDVSETSSTTGHFHQLPSACLANRTPIRYGQPRWRGSGVTLHAGFGADWPGGAVSPPFLAAVRGDQLQNQRRVVGGVGHTSCG